MTFCFENYTIIKFSSKSNNFLDVNNLWKSNLLKMQKFY